MNVWQISHAQTLHQKRATYKNDNFWVPDMMSAGWGRGVDSKFRMNKLNRYIGPLKRFIGPGLVVSMLAHAAPLFGGVLIAAYTWQPPPPEAMEVELVQLKDAPGFGPMTTASSSANGQAPVTQAPPPKPQTERQTEQKLSKMAAAEPLSAAEATQAELMRSEPEKQNQPSEARPNPPQPDEPTPEQPNFADMVAEYTKQGGLFGGLGHEAGEDFTLPFRERLISCSKRPVGIEASDKVIIRVRMSFNQDGSLSSRPRLLVPAPSAKQRALMVSVVDALESCQPFTMLPADKYDVWKTLVWYIGFPVTAFMQ
jgi:hypothetical protein